MGQAVVDLPDPMEQPPAAGASADDLLAQLAGDEIDRLLGEADVEKAPAADAAPALAAPALAEAAVSEAPAVESAPADIPALLTEAREDAAAEPAPPAVLPEPSGPLDRTIAAEAGALLGSPEPSADAAAGGDDSAGSERDELLMRLSADAGDEAETQPLPLWLRPLEWLSAPVDALSPAAREFLGKAAIVTLVNSAAVIAYVVWFRR